MLNYTKHTLITGASSGIGRAIAINMSERGSLILHGRNIKALKETLSLCKGDDHLTWVCDLEDMNVASMFREFLEISSAYVDVFIHSAGVTSILPARQLSRRIGKKVMAVNCFSALEIVSVLKSKRVNRDHLRNIIFISSIWSAFGSKGYTFYCSSKAAIDGAMRALALELAPNVRVNSLLLGAIHTEMSSGTFSDAEILRNMQSDYPLGPGLPEDVAYIVDFLTSSKSRWITGQQIVADGGRSVNMSLK